MLKNHIFSNAFTGLLNNQKWFKIFDWLNDNNIDFKVKILLSNKNSVCRQIREIERTSILFDFSNDFVEFLEIDRVTIVKTNELLYLLHQLKVDWIDRIDFIDIEGYKK